MLRSLADQCAEVPTPSGVSVTSVTPVFGMASIQWVGSVKNANTLSTGALIKTLRVDFFAMVLISFSTLNRDDLAGLLESHSTTGDSPPP